ncbi:exonuclease domain-containing protein [Escherichia coli]|nr:exonuclease domain-containing protein [Escherichia coli]
MPPVFTRFYRTEDLYSGLQQCAFRRRSHTQRFYRNFYDPYAWSWQHDNSRWDLLDVMRACYALRPEGINWPENDDGLPSFRLEHLTKANGIEHSNAHDAMADVYATIAMAKLVKTRQPRLFDYLFTHRNKHKLMALIDVPQMKPWCTFPECLEHGAAIPAGWHRWRGILKIAMP